MLIEVIDRSITYTFNTVQYEYDPLKQELTLQANDSFFLNSNILLLKIL